jgi:chemotaxis protein MotA
MATTIGILLGMVLLSITMMMGGGAKVFFNPQAIMITLGGTLAATLISYPLERVINIFKLFLRLFQKEGQNSLEASVQTMIKMGHHASGNTIYSLEGKIKKEPNRYIRLGLQLLIQDASHRLIARRFDIEAQGVNSRHQGGIQLFSFMAKAAPSFGLVGTLIGLINLLRGLGASMSPETLGPSMAVALITTLYGSLMAFLFFMPAAEKLKTFSSRELIEIRMIQEAILMIKDGQKSRELEAMLNTYLPTDRRKSVVDSLLAEKYAAPAKKSPVVEKSIGSKIPSPKGAK